MLELRNLQRNGNLIEADYYPEDSVQPGHVVVDIEQEKIVSFVEPEGYENSLAYPPHARNGLLQVAKEDKLPLTYKVMWY